MQSSHCSIILMWATLHTLSRVSEAADAATASEGNSCLNSQKTRIICPLQTLHLWLTGIRPQLHGDLYRGSRWVRLRRLSADTPRWWRVTGEAGSPPTMPRWANDLGIIFSYFMYFSGGVMASPGSSQGPRFSSAQSEGNCSYGEGKARNDGQRIWKCRKIFIHTVFLTSFQQR